MPTGETDAAPQRVAAQQRLDKWLWHARFARSRSLATKLVEAGQVRINRVKATKASATVKCGDVLTAVLNDRVRLIEVLAISNRRGPPAEAQALYRERSVSRGAEEPDDSPGGR